MHILVYHLILSSRYIIKAMTESELHSPLLHRVRAFFTFKRVFYIGIIFKGLDGVIELITGVALLFVSPSQIHELVALATRGELSEDPHDLVATLLLKSTSHFTQGTTTFLIIYLGIHAVVKLVSVAGILLKQLWAYPFALITLSLLTLYQVYDIVTKPSVGIVLLTILDIVILWFIAREYKQIREGRDPKMVE